jgi:hypothetical protein
MFVLRGKLRNGLDKKSGLSMLVTLVRSLGEFCLNIGSEDCKLDGDGCIREVNAGRKLELEKGPKLYCKQGGVLPKL